MYPVIVLVRPQLGENIGAAARAMMNFGLKELRLVAPRDGWHGTAIYDKAYEMAAHAKPVIKAVRCYESLPKALHDCHYAFATVAQARDMPLPLYASNAMRHIEGMQKGSKPAFVFGPENHGLSNQDIACCHALITIAAHPDYTSLNLAQAVVIIAYEWFQAQEKLSLAQPEKELPASFDEIDRFQERLLAILDERGYFPLPHKKTAITQQLQRLLLQKRLTSKEIAVLYGVLQSIAPRKKD